jgi:hypothetical protein
MVATSVRSWAERMLMDKKPEIFVQRRNSRGYWIARFPRAMRPSEGFIPEQSPSDAADGF